MKRHTSVGEYVKVEVIPAGLPVAEAARRMGITRQTLHTFLAGRARLSAEMAANLERAFDVPAAELLSKQGALDQVADAIRAAAKNSAGYLTIGATDIENWCVAKRVSSRATLPLLVRRLAFATTSGLTELDFHGEEEAERHGWDGEATSSLASEKVPDGKSCWELSNSANLPGKPNDDIRSREAAISVQKRREISYIYVTPRRWPAKEKWAESHRASGKWKDVRAYDADDLTQWLELSVATQIWFAEQIGRTTDGVRSLDNCWQEWSSATEPKLSPRLFEGSIKDNASTLEGWLAEPNGRPLVLTADSVSEGLAWLACALIGHVREGAVVVSTAEALRRTTAATVGSLIIVDNEETEKAAGPHLESHRVIAIRTKKNIERDADIELGQADHDSFRLALDEMGYAHEDVATLGAQTAHSPTILRRRLAKLPALRNPDWSKEGSALARKLIPLLLAGAWNKSNEWDREIVSALAQGTSFEEIERSTTDLLALADSPVWAIGNYRGIVCRRDALFAVHASLLDSDVKLFLEWAVFALAEDDPSLDLEPDKRWSAGIYGKKRAISGALREAIGDLLVLLAVYADGLICGRLDNIRVQIDRLVERLMLNKSTRSFVSLSPDMRVLAEASPNSFLSAIETDLASDNSQILPMLRPVSPGGFDSPDRTGLLWALELLAWDQAYYLRVIRILTKLSEVPIHDNYMNKPESSLESLISCWHPETCVEVEGRIEALKMIVTESPEIGWRLCLAQVGNHHRMATPNMRPTYRQIARSGPRRMTNIEMYTMCDAALECLLSWNAPDTVKLGELVGLARQMSNEDQQRLIRLIEEWIANSPDDTDKAAMVEKLRTQGFVAGRKQPRKSAAIDRFLASLAERLHPEDAIHRHRWLFAESWIHESRAELEDEKLDHDARQKRIAEKRDAAMAEIFTSRGLEGVIEVLRLGNASYAVGWHLSKAVLAEHIPPLVRDLLANETQDMRAKLMSCANGLLNKNGEDEALNFATQVMEPQNDNANLNDDVLLRLFQICPFNSATWAMVENEKPELADRYWRELVPNGWRLDAPEMQQMVDRLLQAGRPRAAFCSGSYDVEKLDGPTLARVMKAIAAGSDEEEGSYQLDGYCLSDAMEHLNASRALSVDEMAGLEITMVGALTHNKYGIPNLERKIADEPASFVQLVALMFKRKDGGIDPDQFRIPDDANRQAIASNIYHVLENIARTPGANDAGEIDVGALIQWIKNVREQLAELSRAEVGDRQIGQLLGKCSSGKDGIWPSEAVRLALESVGTPDISRGMELAVYNSRGVVTRGHGGDQERVLERKYQAWSDAVAPKHPFTARMLRNIADHYRHDAAWHDTDENVRKRLGRG